MMYTNIKFRAVDSNPMSNAIARELAVVMPVYNEEACVAKVVDAWHSELSRLKINFVMIIINDGSQDGTRQSLAQFETDERVRIINKENSGHGPTVLMGYGMAVNEAQWVFQTDSDNEISPTSFNDLWARRDNFDALFGFRKGLEKGLSRKLISLVSRLTVRMLFGRGVFDVNIPYRLIRAPILQRIVQQIPYDTFAPNIIISGALAASDARIFNTPVPHDGRKTGTGSIVKWKLWKSAFKAFFQTITYSFKIKSHFEVKK